jgi:hypothetical protein
MGKSQRGELSAGDSNPGPGSYMYKPNIGEGPKISMRPKTAAESKELVPGPGQYNPSKEPVQMKSPGTKMGRGSREGLVGGTSNEFPGPGSYAHGDRAAGGPRYSFGKKDAAQKSDDVPGPGHYYIPTKVAFLPDYALANKSKEFAKV